MKLETLRAMLEELSGQAGDNGSFAFHRSGKLAAYIGFGPTAITVEPVARVCLRDGFVRLETSRDEVFLVELERLLALRASEGSRESTGFRA